MTEPIFKIANCRGKKPVIRDIIKAIKLLAGVKHELNECEGKARIQTAINGLENILTKDNADVLIYR